MARQTKHLYDVVTGILTNSFYGAVGQDYLLTLKEMGASNTLFATLRDGDHSIVGSTSVGNVSSILRFGDGSTDVWLTGAHAFQKVRIDGGIGNHAILVDQVGFQGAQINLGHGNSAIQLGTRDGDVNTTITGGNGNFSVKANDLSKVTLGHGDHIVNVGAANFITVGNGDSDISFSTGSSMYGTTIKAGNGNHTVIGDSLSPTTNTSVSFGNGVGGAGSTVQLDGSYGSVNVTGGTGKHIVQIDDVNTASIRLGGYDMRDLGNDMVVHIENVMSTHGVDIDLGGGSHLVDVGTQTNDRSSQITAGDGNSQIKVNGAGSIRLGNGDHIVDAGEVGSIQTGAGNQRIYFEDGRDYVSTNVRTSGGGDDVVVGVSHGAGARASINTYGGNDTIVLLNGTWKSSFINGGSGYDTLYVDSSAAGQLYLYGIENVVYLPDNLTADAALDFIGLSRPDIAIDDAAKVDIARHDFNLTPLPDAQSAEGAVLGYIDLPNGAPGAGDPNDTNPATREDRLMESTSDFFLRANAYEVSYSNPSFTASYQSIKYNDFGDLCGTNNSDQLRDFTGDSQIFGMNGNDLIEGGDGQDRMYGGSGSDSISGGAGQDLLDGGSGDDVLNGGAGIDIFVFRKGDGVTDIQDFEMSFDILDVEGFDNLTYEALTNAGTQIGSDVFYDLGDDLLILRNAELATMVEIDLCLR